MDRRQFLQGSLGATLAGAIFSRGAAAQAPASTNPYPAPPVTRRLILDANSRSLQWMRTADEVAKAAIELTCGGVCVHVRPHPGHVDPARVRTELPAFASRIRAAGLRTSQVRGPELTNLEDPAVEVFVGAASQAGFTHYTLGTLTYDTARPMLAQLDALKPRIQRIVRLNEKHKMTLMFDTVPTPNAIGANVWDLLYVIKEFDPKFVGFHWDTGHMALHGDGMWETLMRTAGPYVAAIGWRDREWVQDIGLKGEGGPFPGPPRGAAAAGRGGAPRAGGPAAPGRAGGAPQGAPATPAPRGGGGAVPPFEGEGDGPPPRAGGPAGAGAPAARGRGPVNYEMPHRPLSGFIGRGNGWSAPMVAMGTGMVDITKVAAILKEINFNGPSELQSEYSTMGGAEAGADKITLPRQFVIGLIKRDVLTIRKAFEMANNGLGI